MESDQLSTLASLQVQHDLKMRPLKLKLDPSQKPIMSASLEAEVEACIARYTNKNKWKEWGMDLIRKQGNAVFLGGAPGTGKTTIARYLAKRIGMGPMKTLSMRDVGGQAPGHTDRMIHDVFSNAKANGTQPIFIDECEAILWDRSKAGSNSMWMVTIIDELLTQIVEYPGLIMLASNHEDIVDKALKSRCFAWLQIGMPERAERVRLWKQKIPARFPLQMTWNEFEEIAEIPLTGRHIETAIVKEASIAITKGRLPDFQGLLAAAKSYAGNIA
jgi:AAA+ superfamily predicted ATPase